MALRQYKPRADAGGRLETRRAVSAQWRLSFQAPRSLPVLSWYPHGGMFSERWSFTSRSAARPSEGSRSSLSALDPAGAVDRVPYRFRGGIDRALSDMLGALAHLATKA